MKKNINLEIKDYRESFNEPHRKNPYFLYIEYGVKSFTFSNKEKAKRFLSKFKKESSLLYKELGSFIANCYSLNIRLVQIIPRSNYLSISHRLNSISERYSYILNTKFKQEVQIGREINNIYYELDSIYTDYIKFLQKTIGLDIYY